MPGVEMGTVPKEPRLGANPQILSLPRDELLPVAHEAGGTGVDEVRQGVHPGGVGPSEKAVFKGGRGLARSRGLTTGHFLYSGSEGH